MSLVLRSNINRRLTVQEMDGNFTYLENLAQTGGAGGGVIEKTYSELVDLIQTSELVTGAYYLITDFKTCYDQPDYDMFRNPITSGNYKVGNTHPLMVLAISPGSISTDAYQPDYPNDKIKYDHQYSQTLVTGGTAYGRIIERIDEWNNRTDYDHREVLYKRYKFYYHDPLPLNGLINISATGSVTATASQFDVDFVVGDYLVLPNTQEYVFEITEIISATAMGVTGINIPIVTEETYHRGYRSNHGINTNGYNIYHANNVDGLQDYQEFPTFFFNNETIVNHKMGNFYSLMNWEEYPFDLPNNVFGEDCINNIFGDGCYNNTFANDVENCQIGNNAYDNTYSEANSDFGNNKIGNFFSNNKMFNNFSANRIKDFYTNNYIYSNFTNNNIDNDFSGNITREGFNENKISNNFYNSKIYGNFYRNSIGNNSYDNVIYSQFENNKISNEFHNNTIGIIGEANTWIFNNNQIGEEMKGNLFQGYVEGNIIGNNFVGNQTNYDFIDNKIGNSFFINTVGNDFRNNQIGNYFGFNQIEYYFYGNKIGDYFNDNIISYNFAYNQIGHNFYNNNIANDFGFGGGQAYGNKIGNYFQNNTIGEYFYSNQIEDVFSDNIIGNYFQYNDVKVQNFNSYNLLNEYRNILSFTDNTGLSPSIVGTDGTYIGLTVSGGSGYKATFDVTVSSSVVTNVSINGTGNEYQVNDVLIISYEKFGGTSSSSNIEITVGSVSATPDVYRNYNCTIFKNANGFHRLSYYDASDLLNITDVISD